MPEAIGATQTPIPANQPGLDPSLNGPSNDFDQDMFLELLVAQLRYQDPLNPMDGSEMMAQTAQLSSVEKLGELTDAIDASLANDRMGTATAFIGRSVTYGGLDGQTHDDVVTGVRFAPTGPVLILGDTEVAMTQVQQVEQAP